MARLCPASSCRLRQTAWTTVTDRQALKVAVIGAGIVGASVAFRLSQGGARVCVLDGAEPASGTTSASFAWINANNKTPREYFDLNRTGMEEHLQLRDELPDDAPWLHRNGNLIQAGAEELDDLDRRVERLRSWSYAAEWWRASQVKAELEPNVIFPHPDTPVAFFPDEGWVEAPRLTKTLVECARRDGADLRFGAAVESIEREVGPVFRLRLPDGEVVLTDAVVNAAGTGAARVAAMLGRELPVASKKGLLARVRVEGELLGRLLHTPRVNLRPDGPGHILLHHGSLDEEIGERPEAVLCEELLEHAREVLSALERAEVSESRLGMRPMPEDGFSCVGGVKSLPGYYEAVTHSGVTLGPLIGRLLAWEILTGEIDPLISPFRPDRFDD